MEDANSSIVLTGATGYLGSRIARRLLARGQPVIATRRQTSNLSRIADIAPRMRLVDAGGPEVLAATMAADVVIHAATAYGRAGEPPTAVVDANTVFPLRLLEAIHRTGASFVNFDTSLPDTASDYALSKAQFRAWGARFALQGRLRFVNLRLEQYYGPGDDVSKFPAYVIRSCMNNVPEIALTRGEQRRDFIYVEDVLSAFDCVLDALPRLSLGWHEYAVGSGEAVTVREFAEMVHRLCGSNTHLAFGARSYRPSEPMHSQADIAALVQLGWRRRYNLQEGLRATISDERKRLSS